MKIGDIKISGRHRKDLGDLASLAKSIQSVGLLHPPVVLQDGTLIAGHRRIAAMKSLGRTDCKVTIATGLADALACLIAERDENVERLALAPREAVSLADAIEPKLRHEAKERQAQGQRSGGRGKKKLCVKKTQSIPRARDQVAAAGMSARTLEKARAVLAAEKKDPAVFGAIAAEMDKTGNVSRAYRSLSLWHAMPLGRR
jgi:hypothetical protein